MADGWKSRGPDRPTDAEWNATVRRVRAEFDEMPGLRVTAEQARLLFGLSPPASCSVLNRLAEDGFLECRDGQFVRSDVKP